MVDYQKFPIQNTRTGFNESVESWLLPRDSYQQMINCHLYRGVLEKIAGYRLFARFTDRNIQSLGTPDGVTKTFTITLSSLPVTSNFFAYGTITVSPGTAETFSYQNDASSTMVNLVGSAGGSGTVNISTGVVVITFNTAPPLSQFSTIFFIWDNTPSVLTAIMGIKQYYENTGGQQVLVFDERRMGKIVSIFGILSAQAGTLQAVSEIPHDYYRSAFYTAPGGPDTITGTFAPGPFVPGTIIIKEYTPAGVLVSADTITDNGQGQLSGTNVTSGSINYFNGRGTLTFSNTTTGNVYDFQGAIYGDLFTGDFTNFFSLTNYQYSAFFTNNVDPIFYYDGTAIHYLDTNLTVKLTTASGGVPVYDITRALHVFTYRERLLLLNVIVEGLMQPNGVWWSTAGDPFDFTNDENLPAPTSEAIRLFGYINTDLIVRFANSERVFRYTADAFSPFRWDSTNNIWACDTQYSAINYDSWFSSIGKPAIVGSDGVNVKRVDEIIPDFTDPTRLAQQTPVPFMSQTSIGQCYGERFDDEKEGWLCYNSSPQDQSEVTASDNVLAFNYLDQTYAVYQFPFSCLGFGKIVNVPTWSTTYTIWQDMDVTWDSYLQQSNALVDLAGDQFDTVFELNTGNSLGDETTPVLMSVITKNFNPFIEEGELCRFGYVDLFVSAYNTTTLRVQFYLNDELYVDGSGNPAGYYQETVLNFATMDSMSSANQTKVWKRIYVGATGKSHTIRLYQNAADFGTSLDQPVYVHAMVLYMKPAGRIFN